MNINKHVRYGLLLALLTIALSVIAPHSTARASEEAAPDLVVLGAVFDGLCNATLTITNNSSTNITGTFVFSAEPLSIPPWGPGPQTGYSSFIAGLPAGQSTQHIWPKLKVFGPKIVVTADPWQWIAESNETNNVTGFPVPERCRVSVTNYQ